MNSNSVYNKLVNFAMETKTFAEFQEMLFASNESNPIRVAWETLEGNNRYYWMYWDSAAYTGDAASRTKELEDMVNIQVIGLSGDWRTLDTLTVSRFRYENRTYIIK